MAQNKNQSIVVNGQSLRLTESRVKTLGRKATLFAKVDDSILYVGLSLLTNKEGLIASYDSGKIVFLPISAFTGKEVRPIVVTFQTFEYGLTNEFRNTVYTVKSSMHEHKSPVYYAAILADKTSVFFTRKGDEYTVTAVPQIAASEHFTVGSNLHNIASLWLKLTATQQLSDIDKRVEIVNGDMSPYGAYKYSQYLLSSDNKLTGNMVKNGKPIDGLQQMYREFLNPTKVETQALPEKTA